MASVSWTSTTGGTWSAASNWSLATGPLKGDDVSVAGATGPLSVVYSGGAVELDSLTFGNVNACNLAFAGGMMNVVNGYSLTGSLTLSAGTMRLVAGQYGNRIYGGVSQAAGTLAIVGTSYLQGSNNAFNQSGGTVQIARGTLVDQETYTSLYGTATGAGTLELNGGTATIGPKFVLSTGAVIVQSGTVYFSESLSYGGNFTLAASAMLSLGSNTLTLAGNSSLFGTVANSTLNLTGTGRLNGLTLENGSIVSLTGTYSETGPITLGAAGTGALIIGAPGMLRISGNTVISNPTASGQLINAGTLIKTAGASEAGTTTIYANVVNTGTIDALVGTMAFSGPSNGSTSTLGGTITGPGSVAFTAGNFAISDSRFVLDVSRTILTNSASMTLTASTLSYGGSFDQTGGTLVVGSPSEIGGSSLALTGDVAFDGGLLKGTGTVLCTGSVNLDNYETLEGNLTFNFGSSSSTAAAVSQTGTIYLGAELDAITFANVGAKESWLLKGNASILGTNGTITNAGVFEKLSGAGDSIISSSFINTGTLAVDSGIMTMAGTNIVLGGTVTGSAEIDITGNMALASGLQLDVSSVVLDNGRLLLGGDNSYANNFSQAGGTLALQGHTLTMAGITSLESGSIQGPGTMVVNGRAVVGQGPLVSQAIGLVQGAQLILNGATEQTGLLQMTAGSSTPTLTIGSTGVYTLDSGATISSPAAGVVGAVVVNAGGVMQASGGGLSVITAAVIDDGTIRVANGDMSFMGPVSGTGTLAISSGGTLEFNSNASVQNAVSFGVGGGVLSLADPQGFTGTIGHFGSGDVIELQGFAFANITPVIAGKTVTLTEGNGQSMTLTFDTAQTGSLMMIGEGPHGGLALIHT